MKEINLKYNVEDLRAIYYSDNKHKYFFGPTTIKPSIYLTISLIAFPIFAGLSYASKDTLYIIAGLIVLVIFAFYFWRVAKPIVRWKKSVEHYLQRMAKVKIFKLQFNDEFFIIQEDKIELKQNWDIISKAIISDKYIWLFSNTNVLLPKSFMTNQEFIDLSEHILCKVKNVETSKN